MTYYESTALGGATALDHIFEDFCCVFSQKKSNFGQSIQCIVSFLVETMVLKLL